jgi:hypothetical protein
MIYFISDTQLNLFTEYTGLKFPNSPYGELSTMHPYNNQEWPYDQWRVMYVYDNTNGCLSILLNHRMTNPRWYAFDHKGNMLDPDIAEHYIGQFEHHLDEPDYPYKPSYTGELKPYPQAYTDIEKKIAEDVTNEIDKQIIEDIRAEPSKPKDWISVSDFEAQYAELKGLDK